MNKVHGARASRLSIIIPCYNEEQTLESCVDRLREIQDDRLLLEIIIVDDCSEDDSHGIAVDLARRYPEIRVARHEENAGKGAALRTGFGMATGDYVAVQDADLEYDPSDLKRLIRPLVDGLADVVLGSRFLATGAHRVLYFWHAMGNRFLTFLSNMFTDLNLTDMETCYKVFRREVIQAIEIEEKRFGFEPEIVAKIAQMRLRIYEMGISYYGRTYEEGKKIRAKDGWRALYCILRYNAHSASLLVQFLLYLLIGGAAAVVNFLIFLMLHSMGLPLVVSVPTAFVIAAIVNYLLCISILFRHKARWSSRNEILIYLLLVASGGFLDLLVTAGLLKIGLAAATAKIVATISVFVFNFLGRRYVVFPEPPRGDWKPQNPGHF